MRTIVFLLLITTSCLQKADKEVVINRHKLFKEITDSSLKRIIKDFTKTNNLDKEKDYISLRMYNISNREIIYIRHNKYLFKSLEPPTFFSELDGFNILIYTNYGNYLEKISWETVQEVLALNGLEIDENKSGFSYHPDLWKLIRCGEGPFTIDNDIHLTEFCFNCGKKLDLRTNQIVTDSTYVLSSE